MFRELLEKTRGANKQMCMVNLKEKFVNMFEVCSIALSEDQIEKVRQMSWQEIAEALYVLFNNLDTTNKMCKIDLSLNHENIQGFQDMVLEIQKKKNLYMYLPDGYGLKRVGEFYDGYDRKTGKKNWDEYEVAPDSGRWVIRNKRNKQVYMVYDTEEKAKGALDYYKKNESKIKEDRTDKVRRYRKYVDSIRNPEKKEYAKEYLRWRLGGGKRPTYSGESFMVGQAVEMQIDAIFGESKLKEDKSAIYKKGFKEGYNNPGQFDQDKLLKSNTDMAKGAVAGITRRREDEQDGSFSFIASDKDLINKISEGTVDHARRELKLAGMFDEDVDGSKACGSWNILCANAVIELMELFAKQGHSGMSASMTRELFNRLSNFEVLTELTDNADEWNDVCDKTADREALWQSRRHPACFSNDGGRTYYNLDDACFKHEEDGIVWTNSNPEGRGVERTMHTSKHI